MKQLATALLMISILFGGRYMMNKAEQLERALEASEKVREEDASQYSKDLQEERTINQEALSKNNELRELIERLTNRTKELEDEAEKHKQQIKKLEARKNTPKVSRGSKGSYLGEFLATAYDDSPASQGKWVGQTATGVKPQVGVIAVDPKVIPLGTKLYVEGYGNCIAGDTGGAIKGKRLDLFMNTENEVYNWGRRTVKVYRRE